MQITGYLTPFLTAFFLCVLFIFTILALRRGLKVLVGKLPFLGRFIIFRNVSRLGGVAMIVAFVISLALDQNLVITPVMAGIGLSIGVILLFGLADDIINLHWRVQLFIQVVVASAVSIFGVRVDYITHPFGGVIALTNGDMILPSVLFVIVWIVLFMNAFNWIDGADGVSGGVALIGAATLFFLSMDPVVNQPPVGIVASAFSGVLLAFLLFNFHPARIIAGTTGAWFMGFALSVGAIFAGAKIATALLIALIPLVNIVWVLWARIASGTPIVQRDRRHTHDTLRSRGWSDVKIALFFYAVTGAVAAVALNTRAIGKAITIVLSGAVMLFVLWYLRDKKRK